MTEDRRISVHELESLLDIGSGSIAAILHDSLGLRKLESRWIPHTLTPEQMAARVDWCKEMLRRFEKGRSRRGYDIVTGDETWLYQYDPLNKRQSAEWVFPDDDPPTQVRRARSVGKQMIACFFARTGHVKTVLLEEHRTVTADWYVTVCLPQVFDAVKNRRPKTGTRGLLLHQDNAPAHTAGRTADFFREQHVTNLSHPPYSPDLAPCDFFLFTRIKNSLRGHHFQSPEDAVLAFEEHLNALSDDDWKSCFSSWFTRMKLCVDAKDYVAI